MKTNKPFLIAVTGTIASGKSCVAELLAEEGIYIIDADELSRKSVEKNSAGLNKVVESFGSEILLPDGTLDRSKLGRAIFNDNKLRKKLEKILHPIIRDLFLVELEKVSALSPAPKIVAYIVPLLFESENKYPEAQKIVVVAADPEICISRIMTRDKIDREFAQKKLVSQMSIFEKIKNADFTIWNNSTKEELKKEVKVFLSSLNNEIHKLS